MGHEIKVSIIIPVYQVERYIVRCIDSVLRQTYRNLEIILVDDCTPDRSMELAKKCINTNAKLQYSEKPNKKGHESGMFFVFLKHSHNRGLSAARNTGIEAATGDYIFFMDSDDELPDNAIEILCHTCETLV